MNDVEILRAAVCIAGLDGTITENEERLLRKLKERAGVGEASFKAMCEMAVEDRKTYYEKQLEYMSSHAEATVRILMHIARADGDAEQHERVIVRHLAEKIGVSGERFEEIASE